MSIKIVNLFGKFQSSFFQSLLGVKLRMDEWLKKLFSFNFLKRRAIIGV